METPHGSSRALPAALWCLAAIGVGYSLALMVWYWPGHVGTGTSTGIWSALAWDFAHGELYRPVWDERGTGGTRYMPGFFMLHGLAIRMGADVLVSGVLLVQLGVLLLVLAVYATMRELELSRGLALPLALSVYATSPFHGIATCVKADYLAVACVALAVAAALRAGSRRSTGWTVVAGIACACAFLVKLTSAYALLLITIWMVRFHLERSSIFLLSGGGGSLLMLVVVQVASRGNFLASIRETASGGGDAAFALGAPARLVKEAFYYHPDVGLLFLAALLWTVLASRSHREAPTRDAFSLIHSFFTMSGVVSLVILASPGTVANHLVDLQVACVLSIGLCIRRRSAPGAPLVFAVWGLGLLATLLPGVPSEFKTIKKDGKTSRKALLDMRREFFGPGPYLSSNQIVPIVNGDRPFVLDFFNLGILMKQDHPAVRMVSAGVARGRFSAIVMEGWVGADLDQGDPELASRGPKFLEERDPSIPGPVQEVYHVVAVRSGFAILKPRSGVQVHLPKSPSSR